MKIIELFKNKKHVLSFEISPPRSDMPLESIFDTLKQLRDMKPSYISVTYGAGGNQKGRTIDIAAKIKNDYGIESMSHFTCAGYAKEDIDAMLDSLVENKLENILALRGDPPINDPYFDFSKNTYSYASELIRYIRSREKERFCIAGAAYTEGHVDSKRIKEDIRNLKTKVDEGVDFLVTQLFFDNRLFYDFLDKTAAIGINCPITPGIMPIFKAEQIKSITAKSGCSIPAKLVLMMDKYADNPDDLRKAGIEYAASQIQDLIVNGAAGIHLYVMNRPKSCREILVSAGLL